MPDGADAERLIVAYEPVWAIGTGLTPTIDDIAEIHAAIRGRIPAGTSILYGGSVNPKNAAEILALDEVDGALVGGASLKADDFWAIAQAAGNGPEHGSQAVRRDAESRSFSAAAVRRPRLAATPDIAAASGP